jgi:hypothetical protein
MEVELEVSDGEIHVKSLTSARAIMEGQRGIRDSTFT